MASATEPGSVYWPWRESPFFEHSCTSLNDEVKADVRFSECNSGIAVMLLQYLEKKKKKGES